MRRATLAAALVALLSSCLAENQTSLQVLRAVPFEGDCTVSPGDIAQAFGVLDVGISNAPLTFSQGFHVRNNMYDTSDPGLTTEFRTDTSAFVVERAVVSYEGTETAVSTALSTFTPETPVAITVETGADQAVLVTLIPANVGQSLKDAVVANPGDVATVVANFHLEGRSADGWRMTSGTFGFPIQVCNGCLASACPAGYTAVSQCLQGQGPVTCLEPAAP